VVGKSVGDTLGSVEGKWDGIIVVGVTVGDEVGVVDGRSVGVIVLLKLGGLVGENVGKKLGTVVVVG